MSLISAVRFCADWLWEEPPFSTCLPDSWRRYDTLKL